MAKQATKNLVLAGALPATVTIAPVGTCTRHKPTMLWQARATKGAAIVANGLGNKGGRLLAPHPTGGKYKANTVWGVVYAQCKLLGAANGGTFTVNQLQAALVAYNWQANGIGGKHAIAQAAGPNSPQYAGFVGWVATLSTQATAKRFSCAVVAAGQGNAS